VVVGGEERLGAAVLVDEFDHGPGDGEAVIGGVPRPISSSRMSERGVAVLRMARFRHLNHEVTAAR